MFSQGLLIRTEVFEHGIFPTPHKLTLHSIVSLFNSLALSSSMDNKISLDQFKESISKYIPTITPKDSEAYFYLYKVITETDMSFLSRVGLSQQPDVGLKQVSGMKSKTLPSSYNTNPMMADIRSLIVFVFLQTFSSSFRNNFELKQKEFNAQWETPSSFHQFTETIRGGNLADARFSSPINSPRSKTTRFAFNNEYNQMSFFFKTNIRQILKFLTIDLSSGDESSSLVTEAEFNILKMLLQSEQDESGYPLSKYTNLFAAANKISLNVAADWLANNTSHGDPGEVFYIQGLNKSVTIKDVHMCSGKEVRVIGCEESYIYIDACVEYISIVNCVNTTIFVASVRRVCTVDKCENLNLTVAANYLRVGNTVDSIINYYGSFNPTLYGDNRSISIGPYNANYAELIDRIKEAGIPISYKNIQSYDRPLVLNDVENNNINHKIQKVEDFSCLILPEDFKPIHHSNIKNFDPLIFGGNEKQGAPEDLSFLNGTNCILPILCPNIYRDQIKMRYKGYKNTQNNISQQGLSTEEQEMLHFGIQSYFKDWLVHSGALKPILDMAKMIDTE